jgi:hypothetical protein
METYFFEYLRAVKESNKAHNMVLRCAKLILKRAAEVRPVMRGRMIDSVVELIQGEGIKEKEVERPEG